MIFADDANDPSHDVYRSRPRPIPISIYSSGFAIPCVLDALPTTVSGIGIELQVKFELELGQLLVCAPSSAATSLPGLYRIVRCSPCPGKQFRVWGEMLAIQPTEEVIRKHLASNPSCTLKQVIKN